MNNPFSDETPPPSLSVSQLNRQVKSLLESQFGFVWVEGEISNLACPSSGHWYFTLKDSGAQVRCAMFRNRNQRLRFTPDNGDAVKLRARVSLYEGRGEFQLIVEHLELAGAGALQAAFDKLKAKLHDEGLFDSERKQPLPDVVSHVGVITSPTGAVVHDILTVLGRRCPSITVSILPVAVQGDGAAAQIAETINTVNRWQREGLVNLDALIVGRGGGSLEDLWAFNEEIVARAIAASDLPIISAVGHEVDFSIADLVADQRAPTPSAAAEMLSPDQREWQANLDNLYGALMRHIVDQVDAAQGQLNYLRLQLKHPGAALREQAQRIDDLEQRLLQAQKNYLRQQGSHLNLRSSKLQAQSPAPRVRQFHRELQNLRRRMDFAIEQRLQQARERFAHLAQMLDSVSPLGTLIRGYAIVSDRQGKILTAASQVAVGDKVSARLAKGRLGLTIDTVDTVDTVD